MLPDAARCRQMLQEGCQRCQNVDFHRFSSILVGFQGQLGQNAWQPVAPCGGLCGRDPPPIVKIDDGSHRFLQSWRLDGWMLLAGVS